MTAAFGTDGWSEWALSDEGFEKHETFDPNWCKTATAELFEGTGTIDVDQFGEVLIVFRGTHTRNSVHSECEFEPVDPVEWVDDGEVRVEVTSTGLSGVFQGHGFSLARPALRSHTASRPFEPQSDTNHRPDEDPIAADAHRSAV